MIEDQRSATAADPPAADEDPAGEVMIPPGRRAIIGAQLLAGAVLGLSALCDVPVEITTTPNGIGI